MRNRRTLFGLALAFIGILVALLMMALGGSSHRFHAESRLKLKLKADDSFPIFDRDEYAAMAQFLNRNESRRALASATGIEEMAVRVDKVGPVRGTSLFYIYCSGRDSNKVQCLASNAASAIIGFYATNQPAWEVSFIDSGLFSPPALAERLKRFIGL